jgi:2-polyprenyl-3-methyl-5-hydroxy-6-metoxy-1,4-benzoquinol methylase
MNQDYSGYEKDRLDGKQGEMGSWPLVAPYLAGKRTLDIGCSDGMYLKTFAAGSRGIEQLSVLAEAARQNGMDVIQGDVFECLSGLQDASFQGVLFSHVMEHVERPIDVLREINRVLVPHGTLVLGLPTEKNLFRFLFRHDYFDGTHIYSFSVRNARKLLEITGFLPGKVVWHLPKFRGKTGTIVNQTWNSIPFFGKEQVSMAYWLIAEKA